MFVSSYSGFVRVLLRKSLVMTFLSVTDILFILSFQLPRNLHYGSSTW